jgi:hypothetical protein
MAEEPLFHVERVIGSVESGWKKISTPDPIPLDVLLDGFYAAFEHDESRERLRAMEPGEEVIEADEDGTRIVKRVS